ncbi:tyrosine-type recombinase/integrase [bacterium]|nr:tyrosine-type recombinase/integrase [bacterium]
MERASQQARKSVLTEIQARKVVSDIVERASGEPIIFHTIIEWFQNWLEMKGEIKSKRTHERYKGVIDEFLKFLGNKAKRNLTLLTQKDIHGFRLGLKKDGLSNTSCNQSIKILSTSLNAALRQGIIPMNPAAAIESLPKEESVRQPFTPSQIKATLKVASSDWRIAILFGFYTGARLSDIANMTWDFVDFDNGTISFVARKTNKQTTIPLHAQLKEALLDSAGQDDPNAPIMPTLFGKSTGGAHGLSKSFASIMEKAKIDPQPIKNGVGKARTKNRLSFHSLRHSFNSILANKDVAGEIRRKLTGHTSDEMNQKYTHLELERLREAVSVIPDL